MLFRVYNNSENQVFNKIHLATGHKCYKDANVQLLSAEHKRDRVIFATKMSRLLHERGQELLNLVWHSDEKVFRLEWNDQSW